MQSLSMRHCTNFSSSPLHELDIWLYCSSRCLRCAPIRPRDVRMPETRSLTHRCTDASSIVFRVAICLRSPMRRAVISYSQFVNGICCSYFVAQKGGTNFEKRKGKHPNLAQIGKLFLPNWDTPKLGHFKMTFTERAIYTNDDGRVIIWEQDLPKLGQIGISPLPFFEIGPPFLGNEMTAG